MYRNYIKESNKKRDKIGSISDLNYYLKRKIFKLKNKKRRSN